jgi:hypothetical protein
MAISSKRSANFGYIMGEWSLHRSSLLEFEWNKFMSQMKSANEGSLKERPPQIVTYVWHGTIRGGLYLMLYIQY